MKKTYIIDTEIYCNYFLLSAMGAETGEVINFELYEGNKLDREGLRDLFRDNLTVGFNSLSFDLPIVVQAIRGVGNDGLKKLCDTFIRSKMPTWQICRDIGISVPRSWDHIDVIEVAPGMASLKIYGGRLHEKSIEDLPIDPNASLTADQMAAIRSYCVNDLRTTLSLYKALSKQIDLRVDMSTQYGMDLRSKSDAQIAETVILSELTSLTGKRYRRQEPNKHVFNYKDPGIIEFKDPDLKSVFERILKTNFTLGGNGSVVLPEWLKKPITVGGKSYQMGIGGLHSTETRQYVTADDDHELAEFDVASYYPSIILQQEMYPHAIGSEFLKVYQSLVTRRLQAKHTGDNTTSDTLKIAINGSFGKLGSKYSTFYAPDLLIQTTVTGQLALLMLIERMLEVGVEVMSANTDGVVLYYPKAINKEVERVAFEWMLDTTYTLEKTSYKTLASRNVNNYIAVTTCGKIKGKGSFTRPGLAKNPDLAIVYRAAMLMVAEGIPVETTIKESTDLREFVSVRRVNGGAVWRGQELGRAVRFYYSTEVPKDECIHYLTNSNRVPKSAGSKPVMTLPDTFPSDVDYQVYIDEANKMLMEVGFIDEVTDQSELF